MVQGNRYYLDEKSVQNLYKDSKPKLIRYFYSKSSSIEEAQDLCSEVFARLLEIYNKEDKNQILNENYCFGIAKNVLRENLRQKNKNIEIADVDTLLEQKNFEKNLYWKFFREEVDKSLKKLKKIERLLWRMKYDPENTQEIEKLLTASISLHDYCQKTAQKGRHFKETDIAQLVNISVWQYRRIAEKANKKISSALKKKTYSKFLEYF